MLGMYIESPGRCGAATPQRPSFSLCAYLDNFSGLEEFDFIGGGDDIELD